MKNFPPLRKVEPNPYPHLSTVLSPPFPPFPPLRKVEPNPYPHLSTVLSPPLSPPLSTVLAPPFSKVEKVDVDILPCELVMLIKTYLPRSFLIFLNNYYYKKYHYLVKSMVGKNNFENYIRDIIRRDNDFVFSHILLDYHRGISKIKNYVYKNMMYKNYYYFLTDYCIKNNSIKCRTELNEFLKEQGLCQNRHKKNSCIHIRWKY